MSEDKAPATEETPAEPAANEARNSTRVLNEADVKDTLEIALTRLQETNQKSLDALRESTERLLNRTSAASDLVRRISKPPPSGSEQ